MLMPEVFSNISSHSLVFLSDLCVRLIGVLLPGHSELAWFCLPFSVSPRTQQHVFSLPSS